MATYVGCARSNYVRVVDPEAFRNEVRRCGCTVVERHDPDRDVTLLAVLSDADNGWDFRPWDDEIEDEVEIDPIVDWGRHLADGEVMVLQEAGWEGRRYVAGHAAAFNNRGESVTVNLDNIYRLAADLGLGEHITEALY